MEDKLIYIGKKPAINYALAIITQLKIHKTEIRVVARGRLISKAVDAIQIAKENIGGGIQVKEVFLNTDLIPNNEGRKIKVSTIELIIKQNDL
jgi:archaea-specific DNA-binding protein